MVTYDDAYFYKFLCLAGFKDECLKWIDNLLMFEKQPNEFLKELEYAKSDINEIIYCLHKYAIKDKLNSRIISERLRKFILIKYEAKSITLNDAVKAIGKFYDASKEYSENDNNGYWIDFSKVYTDYDLVDISINEMDYEKSFVRFLNTGIYSKGKLPEKTKKIYFLTPMYKVMFLMMLPIFIIMYVFFFWIFMIQTKSYIPMIIFSIAYIFILLACFISASYGFKITNDYIRIISSRSFKKYRIDEIRKIDVAFVKNGKNYIAIANVYLKAMAEPKEFIWDYIRGRRGTKIKFDITDKNVNDFVRELSAIELFNVHIEN